MNRKDNVILETYLDEIKQGKWVAGQELITALEHLIEEKNDPRFYYDTTEADRRIAFIEGALRLTKSPFYGKNMKLMIWQKAFISALYGFYMADDNTQRFRRALLLVGRKNGKLLDLETPIETPDGTKRFGDIHEGDYVFGHNGKPVRVLWESAIQYDDTYKVTFEDGEEIIAGGSHNWTVTNKNLRRAFNYKGTSGRRRNALMKLDDYGCAVKTTSEMYDYGVFLNRRDGKGKEYYWRVPMISAPVEYAPQPPVFNPYLIGYWLGNGNRWNANVTCHSQDAEELKSIIGEEWISQFHPSKDTGNAFFISFVNGTLAQLKSMGLRGNKFIPDEYFTASVLSPKSLHTRAYVKLLS